MPMSTQSLSFCSNGSSMPSPTDTPPASDAPRLTASIAPGPPPVMTAKPASASARADRDAGGVLGMVARACAPSRTPTPRPAARRAARSPRRTRSGCAAPATGRCAPSPTARASRAAAGRSCPAWICAAPQHDRAALVLAPFRHDGRWKACGRRADDVRSHAHARDVSSGQEPDEGGLGRLDPRRATTCSSRLVREVRVARAEVHRRDAELAEAGDVGPAELGPRLRRRPRPRPPARAGRSRPGRARRARSRSARTS